MLETRCKKANFVRDKKGEIQLAISGGAMFTSHQGRKLVHLITAKTDAEDVAVMLHPHIVDLVNYGEV
jgi:hypothetical protein